MRKAIGGALLAGLVVAAPGPARGEDAGGGFEGSVEVRYRNVSQDGSSRKYGEDFDGLSSGAYLHSLSARWNEIDSDFVDYLRFEANDLGGEPYERMAFRMGRKDTYDLRVSNRKQTYLYNLFGLVDDEDGFTWDAERDLTDVDLTWHAAKRADVFFGFQQVRRDGDSVFLKDVNTDLFRLDTPLDQSVKRYSVGARLQLGRVSLLVSQMLQRYRYDFDNTTEGDAGLSTTDMVTLSAYDWRQRDRGGADLTTITIRVPLGDRVHLAATAFGTLLDDQEVTSDVLLDAAGTTSGGGPYSVTGGTSRAEIEADHLMLDCDLSVAILDELDFHVQARSLHREVKGTHLRDLDGNGVADDTEGAVGPVSDGIPGSSTNTDYTLESITGLFDYAPSPKVRFRAGYRTIDRELERSGFEFDMSDFRDTDFESDGDDTVILGLVVKPVDWFRLNADYEEGDIAQALTAVGATERDFLRARARFLIQPEMQLELGYLDYENTNDGADFRQTTSCSAPGSDIDDGCWNSSSKGTTYSAGFSHEVDSSLRYWLRWARRDVDSEVRIRYDTGLLFGDARNGFSVYDNESTEWAGRIDWAWSEPWESFLSFRRSDSDGGDDFLGPSFTQMYVINQDYSDAEVGVTRNLRSGLYVGARFRTFDYDDQNDRLDYDGEMLTLLAGLEF